MTDIVERLREFEHNWSDKLAMADACQDAADEIERNRADIAELIGVINSAMRHGGLVNFATARAAIAKHQTTTEKEQ